MINNSYAKILDDILTLSRSPVAVRFLAAGTDVPSGYQDDLSLTYCQSVMMAQKGEKVAVTVDNISCANGAAALGLRPLPDKIARGEMTHRLGVFADPSYGANLSTQTPRIPEGQYSAILLAPLSDADFEPDVVILQGKPYDIMWLILASNYKKGNRGSFSTAVSQGLCVDVTVIPMLMQEINISLGCYGSRNATDEQAEEMVMGIPFALLPEIMEALPKINEKVMERTNKKPAYNRLADKMNWQ